MVMRTGSGDPGGRDGDAASLPLGFTENAKYNWRTEKYWIKRAVVPLMVLTIFFAGLAFFSSFVFMRQM